MDEQKIISAATALACIIWLAVVIEIAIYF